MFRLKGLQFFWLQFKVDTLLLKKGILLCLDVYSHGEKHTIWTLFRKVSPVTQKLTCYEIHAALVQTGIISGKKGCFIPDYSEKHMFDGSRTG